MASRARGAAPGSWQHRSRRRWRRFLPSGGGAGRRRTTIGQGLKVIPGAVTLATYSTPSAKPSCTQRPSLSVCIGGGTARRRATTPIGPGCCPFREASNATVTFTPGRAFTNTTPSAWNIRVRTSSSPICPILARLVDPRYAARRPGIDIHVGKVRRLRALNDHGLRYATGPLIVVCQPPGQCRPRTAAGNPTTCVLLGSPFCFRGRIGAGAHHPFLPVDQQQCGPQVSASMGVLAGQERVQRNSGTVVRNAVQEAIITWMWRAIYQRRCTAGRTHNGRQ